MASQHTLVCDQCGDEQSWRPPSVFDVDNPLRHWLLVRTSLSGGPSAQEYHLCGVECLEIWSMMYATEAASTD